VRGTHHQRAGFKRTSADFKDNGNLRGSICRLTGQLLSGLSGPTSRSGSRKASGSYFTKPFAVEHLCLIRRLNPRSTPTSLGSNGFLIKGATKSAAEALFDFRVADLVSMGSAHFLVAAVDRIEARFSAFLAHNPLPEVAVELHELRAVAATQLAAQNSARGCCGGR